MSDLREAGIVLKWERRIGVKVLSPSDTLEFAETRTRQKAHQLGRATRLFNLVDRSRLDQTGQQRYDHDALKAARVKQIMDDVKKELVSLKPIQSLPRRRLEEPAPDKPED